MKRDNKEKFHIGRLIVDKDAGMLVVLEKRFNNENEEIQYELYFAKEQKSIWVGEFLLTMVDEIGIKKALEVFRNVMTQQKEK